MIRSAEMTAPPTMETPEAHSTGGIYRLAWQRKSLIILALVMSLVLGALYYANTQPVYRSEAQILVIRKAPLTSASENAITSFVEDYLTTHTQLIGSVAIVEGAINNKDLKNLSMFANMDHLAVINAIRTGLTVTRDLSGGQQYGFSRGSSVLTLQFRGSEESECQIVLQAIIASYKDYLEKQYNAKSTQVIDYLKKLETLTKEKIEVLQKEQVEFMLRHPFLDIMGKDVGVARREKRLLLEKEVFEADIKAQNLEMRIETIEKALQSNNPQAAILLLAMEYTRSFGDPLRQNLTLQISEKIFDLETTKMSLERDYGPKHPVIRGLEERIAHLKRYGQTQSAKAKQVFEIPRDDAAPDGKDDKKLVEMEENPLLTSIGAQKLELANMRNRQKYWNEKLDELRNGARIDAPNEVRYQNICQNLTMKLEEYKVILEQLNKFDLSKEIGGIGADTINPPTRGLKIEPKAFTVFALATILGLISGFGLAYLADVTDKSFRSPEEIRRRLNLPVLGHIPSLLSEEEEKAKADGVAGPDPILITYYKSKSRKAEVFRAVRTALYFNTRGEGHKVIQITSPNMGDGKTTLATNLAVSIAQSGKRIVLIDADFRRPRIHKIFGLGSDVGFTTVLTGQCELREAIQHCAVPGLSLVTSGPIPPNPAELLTSPRFKELVDELREQFDFVLIDTPPLLVVTDPCVVAPRVDGVLLCIRVAKNGRPVAERAREVLVSLGANVLGVVVNGISLFGQGYGYGYTYGYQYGQYDYAAQYQYKYDYYDRYYGPYDDYYSDKDEDGQPRKAPPAPGAAAPATAAPATAAARQAGWLGRMFGGK